MFCPPRPERTTFPVVELPSVNVCPFVVPITPSPEIEVAMFPEFAEIEATGVPEALFKNANFALDVEGPPNKMSYVPFTGETALLFNCQ